MTGRRAQHAGPSESRWQDKITGPIGAAVLGALGVIVILVAVLGPDASLSLLATPFVTLMIVLSGVGLLVGLAGRPLEWWTTWGLGLAVGAVALIALLWWWLGASGLVDQGYPPSFLVWGWACFFALGVAATGWWSGAWLIRAARIVTVPIVLFSAFLLVNLHYGYWPTMGDLLHRPVAGQVSSKVLKKAIERSAPTRSARFGPVAINSPFGFDGGPAYVWIPPAYDQEDRADLPVLLMLPGWPGNAENWARAGRIIPVADAWAKAHHGVAPVLVFVSGNGADDKDTECVNESQGPAYTYLTKQVPDFITHVLGISRNPARWGTVGFSEGGTCALELATKDPGTYGRFVDISGELVPSYGSDGDRAYTLKNLYHGDSKALLHDSPMWLFAHHRYDHTVGWFTAGNGDAYHERIAAKLTHAARRAGATAYNGSGGDGGHSWSYARLTLISLYPHIVDSMPTIKGAGGAMGPQVVAAVDGAGSGAEKAGSPAEGEAARRRHHESVVTGLPVKVKETFSLRPVKCAATGRDNDVEVGNDAAECATLGYGGPGRASVSAPHEVTARGWKESSQRGERFLLGRADLTGRDLGRIRVLSSAGRYSVLVDLTHTGRSHASSLEAADLSGTVVTVLPFDGPHLPRSVRIPAPTRQDARILAAELAAAK